MPVADPVPSSETLVRVDLGPRSYDIVIGAGTVQRTGPLATGWIAARGGRPAQVLLVVDRNVRAVGECVAGSLAGAGWSPVTAEVEPGERSKSLDTIAGLWDRLVEMRADRHTVVVAVGGGVVGDAAGFVAATWTRGVPFVQVPTTLLADVDSSVGGKVGINHAQGKNLVGAFHQPLGVAIDTAVLDTLPDREYRAGLAEVAKYGFILDAAFVALLEEQADAVARRDPDVLRAIVARCCRLKADVVEQDEFERTGLRAVLNYGHTFGHAYEALAQYDGLLHGEGVGIGMTHAARLAARLGRIGPDLVERQTRLLERLGVAVRFPNGFRPDPGAILDRMRLDKKSAGGKLRFVLPSELGRVELVSDVPTEAVRAVLDEALAE